MNDNIVLDLFSKKTETHEMNITRGEILMPLKIIMFEGEMAYRKETKKGDILSGDIIQIFHNTEPCFFRDAIFIL